jgi:membrane protein
MPRALRRVASVVQAHWVTRILARTTTGLARLEIFDRAMTVAAQAFTSTFPVLILIGALVGRRLRTLLEATVELPTASRQLLGEAFGAGGAGAFGVVGSSRRPDPGGR